MLKALLETTLHVHARVNRGAKLLDQHRPGWADEIDVDRLNIASPYDCVLGQLSGVYCHGLMAHGLPNNHAACHHGFIHSLISMFVPPLGRIEDACLRDAWIAVIRERTARERPQPRVPMLPCRCRTAEASVANGVPSYALQE